ncbi:PilZ domain-containing protein [Phyllobacterium zundukense]|uniref:PilZ domain-containing protein n=1 Tax=Phyllobacterium zundukense TaxID=1867719 RepID=A0ACD4CZC6_9HYPH|nr:PilZ domain-containing protein [Phyllobacterium zundukense]UXN58903.1 PilZ domain-containing protein [Phyllobacterium zundukense]
MPLYQTNTKAEKRVEERKRTRLRSGKLVTLDGQFLTECHFHNLAGGGAKIRVVGQSPVPTRFWLFDDQYNGALITDVVWRQGMELGVQFVDDPDVTPLTDTILRTLAGKYYSL